MSFEKIIEFLGKIFTTLSKIVLKHAFYSKIKHPHGKKLQEFWVLREKFLSSGFHGLEF